MHVASVNDAPVAVGAIPNQVLEEGGGPMALDLEPYFEDPDGDSLTYTAASSDPGAVSVSVIGSAVMLTPTSYGPATTLGRRVGPGGADTRSRLMVGGRSIALDGAGVWQAAEQVLAGWTASRYLRGGGLAAAGRDVERRLAEWAADAAEHRGPGEAPTANLTAARARRARGSRWRVDFGPSAAPSASTLRAGSWCSTPPRATRSADWA